MDALPEILSIATALGIGGATGAWLSAALPRRNQVSQREHDLKQARYMCILILMLARLSPQSGLAKLRERRPDLATIAELGNELSVELLNAVIFASDHLLTGLSGFINNPNHDSFVRAAVAMRQDLW